MVNKLVSAEDAHKRWVGFEEAEGKVEALDWREITREGLELGVTMSSLSGEMILVTKAQINKSLQKTEPACLML